MNFFHRFLAGLTGAFLYPPKHFVSGTIILAAITVLAIPLSFTLLYQEFKLSLHPINAILASIALLPVAAILIHSIITALVLITFILSPFIGFLRGWEHGFRALFSQDADLNTAIQRSLEEANESAVLNRARHALTIDEFKAMSLTDADILILKNNQENLTKGELIQLKSDPCERIKKLVERYENLQTRLTGSCPISFGKPKEENATLLVKQYFKDNEWRAVPNSTHLFDLNEIKRWLTTGATTHPATRDNLRSPSAWKIDGEEFPARYVHHPLYVKNELNNPIMISQEHSEITAELKLTASLNQLSNELTAAPKLTTALEQFNASDKPYSAENNIPSYKEENYRLFKLHQARLQRQQAEKTHTEQKESSFDC